VVPSGRIVTVSGSSPTRATSSQPNVTDESVHAMWLLKRVFHQGYRAVGDAVRPHGITPTQMGALNRLSAEPGLSGAELARRMLVTPQAAQLAVVGLERRGLVERVPDAHHGRIVRTYLTDEGRRVTDAGMAEAVRAEDRYLAVLDAHERKTLLGLLMRLAMQEPPAP
jgi:DNA-binding MarR family transcriptional regulator